LFVTIYATLITLFGLAWVLFLIGWINVAGRQSYLINVIDNVLVALFAVVGDGLAPFRAVDTYHMIYIAHYHHLTWSLRKKLNLPKLVNENDLPVQPGIDADVETGSTAEAASAVNDDAKSTILSTSLTKPKLTTHSLCGFSLLLSFCSTVTLSSRLLWALAHGPFLITCDHSP
jgi:hypothetical protein